MRKILCCSILAALPALASATPYTPIPPFATMYETYNEAITDHLYTQNLGEVQYANSVGYGPYSTPFSVEIYPQATTTPLERWYGGAPQTEHVYNTATYPQDLINVTNLGYTHEGTAGHVYTQQMPGSEPLYRLVKFNPANFDHVHIFTTSAFEMQYFISQGWVFDHIEGYVPTAQTSNMFPGQPTGFPYLPGGNVMTRRCGNGPGCATGLAFRNNYYGYQVVNSTPKGNKHTQVMNFDLFTPDYFSPQQGEHIAIGMHGHWNLDFSNIDDVSNPLKNHHAYGLTIGGTGCAVGGGNGGVRVEAFVPVGNYLPPCDAQSGMFNNRTYHFMISVSDGGTLSYRVNDTVTNAVVSQGTHQASNEFPFKKYGFPSSDSGWFIVPSTGGSVDYTIYMSNFSVTWQ